MTFESTARQIFEDPFGRFICEGPYFIVQMLRPEGAAKLAKDMVFVQAQAQTSKYLVYVWREGYVVFGPTTEKVNFTAGLKSHQYCIIRAVRAERLEDAMSWMIDREEVAANV